MNTADKIWKARYDLNRKKTGYKSSAEFFSEPENAERMTQNLFNESILRVKDQLACLNFEKGSSVLDIGAGPGTLAVPLAAKGCRVTVVEPSVPMHACMEKYRIHCGVEAKISVIPKTIEELGEYELQQFDYVISSFAMAVRDLKDTLLKMNRLAKKQVHIFWFLNNPSWAQIEEDLREQIHAGEKSYRTHANLIWNCLFQEEIYANLAVYPMRDSRVYADINEACEEYADRLGACGALKKARVSEYLKTSMISKDGGYALKDNGKYAHIWWDKQ